jgi:nitrite reductase/ring-hydroxylating ferredoxin subunit
MRHCELVSQTFILNEMLVLRTASSSKKDLQSLPIYNTIIKRELVAAVIDCNAALVPASFSIKKRLTDCLGSLNNGRNFVSITVANPPYDPDAMTIERIFFFSLVVFGLDCGISFQLSQTTKTLSLVLASKPTSSSDDTNDASASVVHTTLESNPSSSGLFENFDYNLRWYPVIWARDLLSNEPTKVTVFDIDYVVAKTTDTEVIALEDRCPHKAAALSEGRITETGNFQCAYHGWAFDGKTGICKDIPQVAQVDVKKSTSVTFPSRSCAKAVPAQIHQEMVYLFVGGSAEDALLAPPPPTVEEYNTLGFQMSCSIRDMPVDWPIVGKIQTAGRKALQM